MKVYFPSLFNSFSFEVMEGLRVEEEVELTESHLN